MGEVFAELEQVLRSNGKEKITLEEELVLQKCKARAVNSFLMSSGVSGALIWGATRSRLSTIPRTSLSVGTALFLGGHTFHKSFNSCIGRILSEPGTRLQRELSKIILAKKVQDPSSSASKLYYPEQVFNDSNQDKPLTRWRRRSFYADSVTADSPEDCSSSQNPPDSEPRQQTRNPGGDIIAGLGDIFADPLDYVFGFPETSGIHSSDTASALTRRRTQPHKRRHRRHQVPHAEAVDHSTPEILTA